MNNEELKKELLSRFDDIIEAIKNDKVVEIKRCTDNSIQLFEVKKKTIKKQKTLV